MASAAYNNHVNPETSINIKVAIGGQNRRFKLCLKDLGANVLPEKLRFLLAIPPTQIVTFERYSDSAGAFISLDSNNPSVYKQLYRAAKAKLKLRIKATILNDNEEGMQDEVTVDGVNEAPMTPDRLEPHRYVPPMNTSNASTTESPRIDLQTVSVPVPVVDPEDAERPTRAQTHAMVEDCLDNNDVSGTVHHSTDSTFILNTLLSHSSTDVPTPEKKEPTDEAPVPRSFSMRDTLLAELASISQARQMSLRFRDASPATFEYPGSAYSVFCNNCDESIPEAHYHCSICDDGDFDLCKACVDSGILCGGEGHWLIKRFVKNGKVITSTTEKAIAPRKSAKVEVKKEDPTVPGAFACEVKAGDVEAPELEKTRTCNSCVEVFPENKFVTCTVCEDYDLCIPCHVGMKHGHHPSHTFESANSGTSLDTLVTALCAPGRNIRHFAICDGCDKDIYGVRHKCFNCPDWDYCSTCIKSARHIHPGHRFVPIYEPIAGPAYRFSKHHGIYCDGPLCQGKGDPACIVGDRYKCAVCHDTDFCANCEAIPINRHNRTHPLIKFKTPVRNVSVTTLGEKETGEEMLTMGDLPARTRSTSTETTPIGHSTNAATQVHTVADLKPTVELVKNEVKDEEEEKPLNQISLEPSNSIKTVEPAKAEDRSLSFMSAADLNAHFVKDAIPDGSKLPPSHRFEQTWTLRNPGPFAWPAGCSIRFIGGDNMLNVDPNHPSSTADIANATESNVIGRNVRIGEEIEFSVVMKTREREGKSISYWRLKTADGTSFGHKLWCDIDICRPEPVVETEHVEEVLKEESSEQESKATESTMIFPKLDKESPISSTYEAALSSETPARKEVSDDEREVLEDVESLELDETDDGFLTDEEYDILDASDEELLAEVQKGTQK
ncbi:MAG: hypothetical protein M1827_003662 [Pycnora praestabilis]|nr:MAG: hypothetical protein M1827_003662 [Pycnora praestabilis]